MSVHITKSGAIFDGRADKAAEDGTRDVERSVATLGASIVRTELSHVLRIETPRYRFKVHVRKEAEGTDITDGGVIYGPWLEGTGSRNFPKTRFKGYATFRRMTQVINARAQAVGDAVIARYTGRMQ